MNIEEIKALVDIVNNSTLTSFEFSEGNITLKLEKHHQVMTALPVAAPPQVQIVQEQITTVSAPDGESVDFNKLTEVVSPLVGVFYSAPSPESNPFVTIGSKVKKGDVLCIIEAMKVMNEITAECDGEIVDICIKNGDIAEYGQILFKLF